MFGSTLALAGTMRHYLTLNPQAFCGGPTQCLACLETARYLFGDWTASQRSAIAQDLQELYETPMNMDQLRAILRLYPALDSTAAAFDNSMHERARRRTPQQKAASANRHQGVELVTKGWAE
jgi:hypothetical protein